MYLHHGKNQENGKRDSQWKWGVTWLKRGVKFFPAKNEQTSVKMSVKLHSEMSGEILDRVGISQWVSFLVFWNRAISLSTFMIKCKHFQWALLCTILQDTSPVFLSDSPCVCSVRASRLLSTNVGCWLLTEYVCVLQPQPCRADVAPARCQHSPDFSAPVATSTVLVWALQVRKDLLKTFLKMLSLLFLKLLINVWELLHSVEFWSMKLFSHNFKISSAIFCCRWVRGKSRSIRPYLKGEEIWELRS